MSTQIMYLVWGLVILLALVLIDIVSRGGNLLLNVGPTADGRIPVVMQERLLDIGRWLKINKEVIYGTRKHSVSNLKTEDQCLYFTSKKDEIFCIFTKWNNDIEIDLLTEKDIKNVSFIGYNGTIKWELTKANKLKIEIPKLTIDEIPCLHAWSLKIKLEN